MELSFAQKSILVLYKEFYKKEYDCSNVSHIQMQNAIYVLWENGISSDMNFEFTWVDNLGPYSPELENQLKILDLNGNLLIRFYNKYNFSGCNLLERIYKEEQIEKIENCCNLLDILFNYQNIGEILGGLLFIGKNIYPGADFDYVNEELKKRKPHLNDDRVNMSAWNCLKYLNLLKTFSINNSVSFVKKLTKNT